MLPITDFLSCTDPLDEFDSLSYHQTHHAKTYVTGLAAGRSKSVTGIAREVFCAQGERALNKFLTEYDWDEKQLNHERSEELQKHAGTRQSQDGHIVIHDSGFERTGKEFPGAIESSTIKVRANLFGGKTSSIRSTLTIKHPIRSCFASTRKPTTKIKITRTKRSMISLGRWSQNLKKR